MRATVTTTHDRCLGILDGTTLAHFPDGCPEPGDYDLTLAARPVNYTGEPRQLVTACTPAKAKAARSTQPDPD